MANAILVPAGVAYATNLDGTPPPNADLINVISPHIATTVGFTSTGMHPLPPSSLWSGSISAGNEYLPYDKCL